MYLKIIPFYDLSGLFFQFSAKFIMFDAVKIGFSSRIVNCQGQHDIANISLCRKISRYFSHTHYDTKVKKVFFS